jgi:DNA-directed RNA polymerase subunit RPC12/RpoP
MTPQQFKDKYPQYKDLEGDDLWNRMELMLLYEQQQKKPKKYQLRWLFYRNKVNFSLGKNNYTATERCSKCKKGVSFFMAIWWEGKTISNCPHCGEDLVKEKNTSFLHKLHTKKEVFWKVLDWLHICRDTIGHRYDMFNDEHYFIMSTEYTNDWEFKKHNFRKRKWWEYIVIEKR